MTAAQEAALFVDTLNQVFLYPLITLLSAVALLVFLYGLAEYFMGANNEQQRTVGRSHMIYGLVGLFIMVSAWAILRLFAASLGVDDVLRCANDPDDPTLDCDAILRTAPTPSPTPGSVTPTPSPTPGSVTPTPSPTPGS